MRLHRFRYGMGVHVRHRRVYFLVSPRRVGGGVSAMQYRSTEPKRPPRGSRIRYKGIRYAALYRMSERCTVRKGCLLEADHRGVCYLGID